MGSLADLLELVKARNVPRSDLRFHMKTPLVEALKETCVELDMPLSAAVEAVAWGLVQRHPAALAMVDQWKREQVREKKESRAPKMSAADLDEIRAAAKGIMIGEED